MYLDGGSIFTPAHGDGRAHIAIKRHLKSPYRGFEVGARVKGDWPALLNILHGLLRRHPCDANEVHGHARRRALHTGEAVHEHGLALFASPPHLRRDLVHNFKGPVLEVPNLLHLQIVVDGYTIASLYSWLKRDVLCAVKNGTDLFGAMKLWIQGGCAISEPEPGNNLVSGISLLLHSATPFFFKGRGLHVLEPAGNGGAVARNGEAVAGNGGAVAGNGGAVAGKLLGRGT